jgi:valyl-tRNA synthetase
MLTPPYTRTHAAPQGRLLHEFLWGEVADWYVEVSKTRIDSSSSSSSSSSSTATATAIAIDSTTTMHESAKMAEYVLLYIWSRGLKLLHPYMPYVTETLYQNISPPTPTPTHAHPHAHVVVGSIMVSEWPLLVPLDQLQQRSGGGGGSSCRITDTDTDTGTDTDTDDDEMQLKLVLPIDVQSIQHFSKLKAIVKTIRNMRITYGIQESHKIHATVYVPVYGTGAGDALYAELGM